MVLPEPSDLDVEPYGFARRPDSVRSVYQPIVTLGARRELVGFEALARWPAAPLIEPVSVFAAARAGGVLEEVDWACRLSAIAGALERNLGRSHTLFVNVEPDALRNPWKPCPEIAAVIARARGELRIIFELTERAITDDPCSLLRAVDTARANGWGIALDDVGSNPQSLALLPLIQPDVIKLDQSLLEPDESGVAGEIAALVREYADSTGASVLAEGIESPAHLRRAVELGARYGQGRMLGDPAPLPALLPTPSEPIPLLTDVGDHVPASPGALLDVIPSLRVDAERSIIAIDRLLDGVEDRRDPLTVLCAVDSRSPEAGRVAHRVACLADRHPFVAIIGIEEERAVAGRLGSAARWSGTRNGDPVTSEWAVVAIGSRTGVALLSRSATDHPAGDVDLTVSYDRTVVRAAGRSLSRRVTALAGS